MNAANRPNTLRLPDMMEPEDRTSCCGEYPVVHGSMQEEEIQAKFCQTVSAEQYGHQMFIVHGDSKTENQLLEADLNVEFETLASATNSPLAISWIPSGAVPYYAAPELSQGQKYNRPAMAVWRLGQWVSAFDGQNFRELWKEILGNHTPLDLHRILKPAQEMSHSQSQQEKHFRANREGSMDECGS